MQSWADSVDSLIKESKGKLTEHEAFVLWYLKYMDEQKIPVIDHQSQIYIGSMEVYQAPVFEDLEDVEDTLIQLRNKKYIKFSLEMPSKMIH